MAKTVENKTVDNKDKKSKLLTAAVVVFLCLTFVVGFIWGLNSVLAMEGSYPPETDTHGFFTEPKSNEEVIELLNTVLKGALDGKPRANISNSIDVDGGSVETDGSDTLKDTILFAKDGFVDGINEKFENAETDFSEELKMKVPQITAADIESFECKYFARNYVYQCGICGAENDELLNGCPECGSTNLYEQQGRGTYVVNIVLKNDESVLNNNFAPKSDEEIRALMGDDFNGVLDIDKIDVSCDKMTISFQINRENGELTYLEYRKDLKADTDVTFTDKYESLGKTNVKFNASEIIKNEFTWPALTLSADEMIIEPKKSDNLTATLTCSDPTKPVVTWKSSDENVVTIDDEGYMKAGKEPGEATVTATFEFLGKTYTDSCKIKVLVPVESMDISTRNMKLSVGETKTLKAKVSPAKATVQTATWYTEDESIATVDENGTVKAVSSGTVTVYALSDDGFFKSSCEVTVK